MNKKQIIILIGIVLIVAGILNMVLLEDYEYRHILGGGLIGGGIGLLFGLKRKKK